eukprot:COSAG01_NODE_2089_length_8454_cov_12.054339_1_plen_170_part_00
MKTAAKKDATDAAPCSSCTCLSAPARPPTTKCTESARRSPSAPASPSFGFGAREGREGGGGQDDATLHDHHTGRGGGGQDEATLHGHHTGEAQRRHLGAGAPSAPLRTHQPHQQGLRASPTPRCLGSMHAAQQLPGKSAPVERGVTGNEQGGGGGGGGGGAVTLFASAC